MTISSTMKVRDMVPSAICSCCRVLDEPERRTIDADNADAQSY